MAANDTPNPYRQRALDLQVTGYHAAAHALLDMNPDGFTDRSTALQVLMDRLTGYMGEDKAADAWATLRDIARQITGVNHGALHTCVKEQVLGRLTIDLYRISIAPTLVPSDPFAGLPS